MKTPSASKLRGSPPAGFWVRFLAEILDSLLLNALAWLVEMVLIGAVFWAKRGLGHETPDSLWDLIDPFALQTINALIYLGLAAPYTILGHAWYGTTLSKRLLGIYVCQAGEEGQSTGDFLSVKESVFRFLGYLVSALPLGAGYLMVAFHPKKRGLHELISGSCSVRIRSRV